MTSTPFRTRKLFLLLGSVGLLAASFVLTAPRTASASPAQSCDCIYPNGEQIVFCNGQVYREGTISGYPMCSCEPCS